MNIVHVVPHIHRQASGPSYSVPRLCQSLAWLGHDVELACLAPGRQIAGVKVEVHPEWSILDRFGVSFSHARALRGKSKAVDLVHNHSLWSMVNVASGWVVPKEGAMLVVSPRGTLAGPALRRSSIAKGALWPLQRRALDRAALLHATSEAELRDIRASGFGAPVAVIPNGVDVPAGPATRDRRHSRVLLYLGRLHPIKGIDLLLQAWGDVQDSHPDWKLVIAGGGEPAYVSELRRIAASSGAERAEFVGPVYGERKSDAFFAADLFVLPTHSENFGMVVAEALAHGRPVIVSRGAPWSPVEREGCGWWVSNDVESLSAALDKAMRLDRAELDHRGAAGRAWMRREFSWEAIGERMADTYRWRLDGGPRPAYVHT